MHTTKPTRYVGIQVVDAVPMTRGEFETSEGGCPLGQGAEAIEATARGYSVQTPDGSKSWIPADIFETNFRGQLNDGADAETAWQVFELGAQQMDADADPIEKEIRAKGKTGPRVTAESLEAKIVRQEFHRLTDVLTVCVLTMENGFTVTGESACADPANYDEAIGRKIARANAFEKLWPLEGYFLRERLHREAGRRLSIARVAHEVNRAYCQALGDNSQPSFEEAPGWQRDSALLGVNLHADGEHGPEASHASWMAQKLADGWTYGPVKDPEAKTHPCLVPFKQLPPEQQAKDYLFRAVVHALR